MTLGFVLQVDQPQGEEHESLTSVSDCPEEAKASSVDTRTISHVSLLILPEWDKNHLTEIQAVLFTDMLLPDKFLQLAVKKDKDQ